MTQAKGRNKQNRFEPTLGGEAENNTENGRKKN